MSFEALWYRKKWRLLSLLLLPLSWLYGLGAKLHRNFSRPQKVAGLQIVSVGNIVVGGAGKTPLVIWLAQWAQATGKRVVVLSRGYGRTSKELVHFNARSIPSVTTVGDEPALIARRCPGVEVWVGADRLELAQVALKHGAQIAILDDGFQHHRLARDVDVVIAGDLGNARLLPAGPLREPVSALKRAHVIVQRGDDDLQARDLSAPRVNAQWEITGFTDEMGKAAQASQLSGLPVIAVSGIARPLEFERQLRALGADVKASLSFADHQNFSDADLRTIRALSTHHRARVITTEKDRERLGSRLEVLTTRYELRVTAGVSALSKVLGWPEDLVPHSKH